MTSEKTCQRIARMTAIIIAHKLLLSRVNDAIRKADLWEMPDGHPSRNALIATRDRLQRTVDKLVQYTIKLYVEKPHGQKNEAP